MYSIHDCVSGSQCVVRLFFLVYGCFVWSPVENNTGGLSQDFGSGAQSSVRLFFLVCSCFV